MRAFAGRTVALRLGNMRLCWRIDEGGRWRAAIPVAHADAEAGWSPGDSAFHIAGDGALLRELENEWKENMPRKLVADFAGEDAANALAAAMQWAKTLPAQSGLFVSADEVSQFNKKVAAAAKHAASLAARLAALEAQKT